MADDAASTGEGDVSPTIALAADGDVVLVVGPDRRRLRVSSIFVKNASPVLKAMLGPKFKEGHQLTQRDEVEIPLPDDNAEALEIVLTTIHGHNDKVPTTLSPTSLLRIAITVDKYDCYNPLAFVIRVWHESACSSVRASNGKGMWALAMAALVLDLQPAFAKITSTLIFAFHGPYLDLVEKDGCITDRATQLKTAGVLFTCWASHVCQVTCYI